MSALIAWIESIFGDALKGVNIVIGSLAAIIVGVLIIQGIMAIRKGTIKDILPYIGKIVIVVLLALIGIKGFQELVKKYKPDSSVLPTASITEKHLVKEHYSQKFNEIAKYLPNNLKG